MLCFFAVSQIFYVECLHYHNFSHWYSNGDSVIIILAVLYVLNQFYFFVFTMCACFSCSAGYWLQLIFCIFSVCRNYFDSVSLIFRFDYIWKLFRSLILQYLSLNVYWFFLYVSTGYEISLIKLISSAGFDRLNLC